MASSAAAGQRVGGLEQGHGDDVIILSSSRPGQRVGGLELGERGLVVALHLL
jgi:hypothetical protein